MRSSTGRLVVTPEECKLHVVVDPGIVDVTRTLIPRVYLQNLNRTRYPPHISVIRDETWTPDMSLHGLEIDFNYDPRVVAGKTYWWLNCWSDQLVAIRAQQGLVDHTKQTMPPDLFKCFHCTIGNTKRRH